MKIVSICSISEWLSADSTATHLIVGSNCLNNLSELQLDRFILLKELVIGDNSLNGLTELSLVGLNRLERVGIGSNSFKRVGAGNALRVKDCSSLKRVAIGDNSFSSYGVIDVSSVPSLEDLRVGANCFSATSLELKSLSSMIP